METFNRHRNTLAPYGFTCVRWEPSLMPRADRHNEIELNLLRDGSITYRLGEREVTVESPMLALFWAATPHQIIDFSAVTEFYVATIPLPWFLAWSLPDHLVQRLLRGHLVSDTCARPERDLLQFKGWVQDLASHSEQTTRAVALEIEARLLRLQPEQEDTQAAGTLGGDPARLDTIIRLLSQNYTRKVSIDEVGEAANLHPNYAMTLFKRHIGMSITTYLNKLRVTHAQHLLSATRMKMVDVAASSGFASLSRFNAAFRSESGLTPREYRTQFGR